MSAMKDYLDENTGVVLSIDEILLYLLWAEDMILTSTSIRDAQSQLDGLSKSCSKNKSIVYAIKSKFMTFGQMEYIVSPSERYTLNHLTKAHFRFC